MGRLQPFLNIRTEGALLPSDLLSRLVEGINLPGLKPEDYHLGAGEKLNEAISRSWTRLLSLWSGFRKAQAALAPTDLGTTLTRERWLLQLFQELGYGRLIVASPIEIDGKTYPISHIWQGQYYQVPIHLISFRADLDKRSEQRIQGASRSSPHGMVQEFLNRSEHHLWALVSNGLKLLILRDSASLTRQAYVEFDLESIFDGESYADFRLLWMLCHQSRLEGTTQDRPETCWLEIWSKQAETEGRRALDQLRIGVQKALESLGTGFVAHKANQGLRDRLQSGELHKQDFYRQLLRLVYRLIFLFVAEDRDLLHSPGASDEARSRYARFYSGQRLRRMAERTRGSLHADLWVGLRLVFAKLGEDGGCPELGLPVLGGFLFGPRTMPDLEAAALSNEHLLQAIRNLGLVKDRSGWRLVNYRNLGSEELGSVYESLLELNPTMELDAGIFNLGTVAGNQRKTSGSYYTPDSLVQCLLDSALDPVVEQATKGKTPAEAERAILALKVCDPAVGSGHFLVGAAHRLAKHLARVRAHAQGESEPSPLYYQHALRDVIGRCLYGVDVNPMAAELCRVSLWLEAIEPGKPLSFLDHHIRVGNSLLGTTPALLAKGIPDEAFTPIEGDDKEVCKRFKKLNKEEKIGFLRLFAETTEPWEKLGNLAASMMRLDDAPDDSIDAIHEKERMYEAMVRSGNYLDGQFWADTWCAAFVWKKTREFNYPITEEVFRRIEHNPHACDAWMRSEITRLSQQYQFFHWHLAFPDVFQVPTARQKAENEQAGWNGGFDVVIGNPPWERLKLEEQEWFAARDSGIAAANNAAKRRAMIADIKRVGSELYSQFINAGRSAEGEAAFIRNSGAYPLCGVGRDINTAGVFLELMYGSIAGHGILSCIAPASSLSGDTTRHFVEKIVTSGTINSLYHFENEELLFPGVHHSFRFCITAISGELRRKKVARYVFYARSTEDLNEPQRLCELTAADIRLFNPLTSTLPTFRSAKDAVLSTAIYRRVPVDANPLLNKGESKWVPQTRPGHLHMSNDAELFRQRSELIAQGAEFQGYMCSVGGETFVPLYESKMMFLFDHRFGTYLGQSEAQAKQGKLPETSVLWHENPENTVVPRYWVNSAALIKKYTGVWSREWCLGTRDIAAANNERTTTGAILPPVAIGGTLMLIGIPDASAREHGVFLAALDSFAYDYCARQKVAGTHLNPSIFKQLPVPSRSVFHGQPSPDGSCDLIKWISDRVLELTYTAWDLKGFAHDCGLHCPPFRWDEVRRFVLRCELDAAFFHLYLPAEANGDWSPAENETAEDRARLKANFSTPRDAVAYIMETFPIVKRKDEEKYGEYRTKRVILEIYDAMGEAGRTGIPDQTRLAPPPADHPWLEELAQVAPANKDAISNLVEVPDEAWATPVGVTPEHVALFSLIDVLRTIGEPADPERIRLAAILVRKPALATAFMEETQADEWIRVVGRDAQPLTGNVIQISHFQMNATDHPWAEAINQLRGSGAFVTDSSGKWLASDRLPMSSGQDWISGRAAVAVQVLAAIVPADAEQKVIAFIRSVEDGTATRAVS